MIDALIRGALALVAVFAAVGLLAGRHYAALADLCWLASVVFGVAALIAIGVVVGECGGPAA